MSLHEHIEKLKQGALRPGIPTGFRDLDHLTGGLRPGSMTALTGPPGVGKTTAAHSIARHVTAHWLGVAALFSTELTREEINHCLIAGEAAVPLFHLRSNRSDAMTDDHLARVDKAIPRLKAAALHIHDSDNDTVHKVEQTCRGIQEKEGPDAALDLVVIDTPHLMYAVHARGREAEVAEISRDLKTMAKTLGVALVVTMPESHGERNNPRNRQIDQVCQDADLVIRLDREDLTNVQSPRAGEMDLIVTKHRTGPMATITVANQFHYGRLTDYAPA